MLPAGAVAAILAVGLSCAAAAGPGTPAGDSAGGVPWTGILLGLGLAAVALVVVSLIRTGRQGWGWAVTVDGKELSGSFEFDKNTTGLVTVRLK